MSSARTRLDCQRETASSKVCRWDDPVGATFTDGFRIQDEDVVPAGARYLQSWEEAGVPNGHVRKARLDLHVEILPRPLPNYAINALVVDQGWVYVISATEQFGDGPNSCRFPNDAEWRNRTGCSGLY